MKGVTVKGEDAASHGDEAERSLWVTVLAFKKKKNTRNNIKKKPPGTLFLKVPKLKKSLKQKVHFKVHFA